MSKNIWIIFGVICFTLFIFIIARNCVRNESTIENFDSLRKINLQQVKKEIDNFIKILRRDYPNDERVKLLSRRYKNTKIYESSEPETYTLNKGEEMKVCLQNYKKGSTTPVSDKNVLMFVILHELAHIMSISNHHTDEFWNNFEFLLKEAAKQEVYQPVDYQYNPVWYCAMEIYENPYFKEDTPEQRINKLRELFE